MTAQIDKGTRWSPWVLSVFLGLAQAGTRCPAPKPRLTPTTTVTVTKPPPGLLLAHEQAQELEQAFESETRKEREAWASRIETIHELPPEEQSDAPWLANTRNGERKGQAPRVRPLLEPAPTVTATGSQGALCPQVVEALVRAQFGLQQSRRAA